MQQSARTAFLSIDPARDAVTSARAAWHAGEFARCLDILDCAPDVVTSEAVLLRARSLLRLDRPAEASEHLRSMVAVHRSIDARIAARMLDADAVGRMGDPQRALEMLEAILLEADAGGVHPTIRSEIAYFSAVALWMLGRNDLARSAIRNVSGPEADIVAAWCASLLVFIDVAEHRLTDAVTHSVEALSLYRSCSARDRMLEASIIVKFAILVSEIPVDEEIYAAARHAIERISWTDDLGRHGTLALTHFAWTTLVRGDELSAMRYLREAVGLAPSDAWRVHALAERGILYRLLGQRLASIDQLEHAKSIATEVDWSSCSGEEALALVTLAEALAAFDPDAAARAYEGYASLSTATSPHNGARRDKKDEAYKASVRGSIAVAQGDNESAIRDLKHAFALFERMGYRRRMLEVAVTLSRLPRQSHALKAVGLAAGDYYRSWIARLTPEGSAQVDERFESLTRMEREVLRVALQGVRPERIAELLGSKVRTVYNHLGAIRRKYGVASHAALLAACAPARHTATPVQDCVR